MSNPIRIKRGPAATIPVGASGELLWTTDTNELYMGTGSVNIRIQTGLTNPVLGTGTANEIAYFTGTNTISSLPTASYPSLTELSYLKGVTSSIQTQLNGKQNALTNPVTGTGTNNYIPKFTGASTIGNSLVYDNGTGGISLGKTTSTFGTSTRTSLEISGSVDAIVSLFTGTTLNGYLFHDGTDMQLLNNKSTGSLLFYTNGSERMRLTSAGNLGLLVTPSAWGYGGNFNLEGGGRYIASKSDDTRYASNVYNDGDFERYASSNFATRYRQANGIHSWATAPSGTAGNAITFTQAMTLNASGNLSIGNTNDTYKLDVSGTGRFSGALTLNAAANSITSGNELRFYRTDNGIYTQLYDGGNANGFVLDNRNGDGFSFQSAGTNQLRIASTGAATFSSSVTAATAFLNSTSPIALSGNSNSGTFNQTVIYANQNNSSNSNENGIFIERGRLSDSSNAEIRRFVIGSRGGQVQWVCDKDGSTTQEGSVKTGAPSGYAAKPYKLGEVLSGGTTATHTVAVEIDGVVYFLLAASSPP